MELIEKIELDKIERIELFINYKRQYMSTIKAQTGADYIINGGIYNFSTFKPYCNVKSNGEVLYDPEYTEKGFAWNYGGDIKCEALPNSKKNYIGCVCLTFDGKKQKMYYNPDMGGKRQRTVIAIDNDNLILYTCNGLNSKTPEKLQEYAIKNGWEYSVMMDGGNSTQMMSPNGSLLSPENQKRGRIVQNYILIFLKNDKNSCPYKEPTTNVRYGTRGTTAKWVQWQLNRLGYDCGTVDGVFGTKSVAALKAFQKAMWPNDKDQWDGICGKLTRQNLKEE